jgi:hypothetical protein
MPTDRRSAAGAVRARLMASRVGRIWLASHLFQGLDNNGTASISLSEGTPTVEPTSGPSELVCIPMTTADEVHTIMPLPWDMDMDAPVAGRIWFAHASTDASDAPVWKVGVVFVKKQATLPELAAGADVVTSITSAATSATDDSLEITPWYNLSWDSYIDTGDMLAGISVELDALGSAGADESEFLGLELAYQRSPSRAQFETVKSLIAANSN